MEYLYWVEKSNNEQMSFTSSSILNDPNKDSHFCFFSWRRAHSLDCKHSIASDNLTRSKSVQHNTFYARKWVQKYNMTSAVYPVTPMRRGKSYRTMNMWASASLKASCACTKPRSYLKINHTSSECNQAPIMKSFCSAIVGQDISQYLVLTPKKNFITLM